MNKPIEFLPCLKCNCERQVMRFSNIVFVEVKCQRCDFKTEKIEISMDEYRYEPIMKRRLANEWNQTVKNAKNAKTE